MSKAELRKFLNKGTFTGKLATVKKDGSSHVVPIWFVYDYGNGSDKFGSIYITTGSGSIKAENIQRDYRISLCVDDQTPPFSFVTIYGIAKLHPYKEQEVLKWATKIAERYMGKKRAKSIGKRNSGEGSVLVQIEPTKIIAVKNITG
ncbi:MAG: PPOX class F420-dependent oxidoreductase [Nitrososphaeraceae archaeon]